MRTSTRKQGKIPILAVVSIGLLGLGLIVPRLSDSAAEQSAPVVTASGALAFQDAARAILRNDQNRAVLEMVVVLLQVGAVAGLCGARFLSPSPWSGRSHAAFIVAMLGLGIAGTLCAWYGSEFALFSGVTMAILLNLVILEDGPVAAQPSMLITRASERHLAA